MQNEWATAGEKLSTDWAAVYNTNTDTGRLRLAGSGQSVGKPNYTSARPKDELVYYSIAQPHALARDKASLLQAMTRHHLQNAEMAGIS